MKFWLRCFRSLTRSRMFLSDSEIAAAVWIARRHGARVRDKARRDIVGGAVVGGGRTNGRPA